MNKSLLTITALFIATLPCAAHAQGTIRGAEEGAAAGDRAAGSLGAIMVGPSAPQRVPSAASWVSRSVAVGSYKSSNRRCLSPGRPE